MLNASGLTPTCPRATMAAKRVVEDEMRTRQSRREFVAGAGAASLGLLAGCGRLPWQAQPPPRVARIGYLSASNASHPYFVAFGQGMGDLGYVEGQNLLIEAREAEGQPARLAAL